MVRGALRGSKRFDYRGAQNESSRERVQVQGLRGAGARQGECDYAGWVHQGEWLVMRDFPFLPFPFLSFPVLPFRLFLPFLSFPFLPFLSFLSFPFKKRGAALHSLLLLHFPSFSLLFLKDR